MSRPDRAPAAVVLVLTTTADDDSARSLARALVEERLAACVTRSPVRSVYRWESGAGAAADPICEDDEVMLLVKTSRACADRAERRIVELHPYECPEVVRVDPEGVNSAYLSWLLAAVNDD